MNLFGADWLAMLASVTALVLLGRKSRWGFVSFMVANVAWILCGYLLPSIPIVLGNMVFFCLNMRGFRAWTTTARALVAEHAR